MTEVEVKKHLRQYMEDMSKYVHPDDRNEFLNSYFIAGGAIASLIQGETPKDYDIYCKKYPVECIIDSCYVICENPSQRSFYLANRIAQFILCSPNLPDKQISEFDYKHTMNYYDYQTDTLHINHQPAVRQKLLIVNNENGSFYKGRYDKFIKRGYICVLDNEQKKKLIGKPNYDSLLNTHAIEQFIRLKTTEFDPIIVSKSYKSQMTGTWEDLVL